MNLKFYKFFLLGFIILFPSCHKSNQQKKIERIVSLGPSATEILFAIGAENQIVARTDLCDYPSEVEHIPSVGGFSANSISLESILSFNPDLVYLYANIHDNFIKPLTNLNIQVFISNATSIEEVKNEIRAISIITNHQEQAEKVIKNMDLTLYNIQTIINEKSSTLSKPSVYWEVWDSPMMSVGKNSFINDIITYAGGNNIFATENSSYPIISQEAVLSAHPDFIIYTGNGTSEGKIWDSSKGQGTTRGGVFYLGDDERFVRSTPRCVDAVERLAYILWKVDEN